MSMVEELLLNGARAVVRRPDAAESTVALPGRLAMLGGVEVACDPTPEGWGWSVRNPGTEAVELDAVAIDVELGPAGDDVTVFCHGYQSWLPSRGQRLGVDRDATNEPDSTEYVRPSFYADPGVAPEGWLRSEQTVVVDLGLGEPLVQLGFLGGTTHEGTFWLYREGDTVRLRAEAWLGGAQLPAGSTRALHPVAATRGTDAHRLLADWADRVGAAEEARTEGSYLVGWCSWYHYFEQVTEDDVAANLAAAVGGGWPFDVFQVDDGFQAHIGDWLSTNDTFPSGLEPLATSIADAGFTPGIWIAPFLAHPESQLARDHPDWVPRHADGNPLVGMYNPIWDGMVWQLDVTMPEVLGHLESVAAELVRLGFTYLKLDFTFSSTFRGAYADPTKTPAERVRMGYEAIRRGAGDDAYILGCGAPLASTVGLVDAMRIGSDVAPYWLPREPEPGTEYQAPSVRNAYINTLSRTWQHRRLWQNDPDCLMLRHSQTDLTDVEIATWSAAVAVSGGLALVSDDLALLGERERVLLDRVIEVGRAADAASLGPDEPRCGDLMRPGGPTMLSGGAASMVADPERPEPTFGGGAAGFDADS